MIEAIMFWNEPNNKSHWDFEIDPEWRVYADMVKLAADAVRAENPRLLRVLGGISPIDPNFIRNMKGQGALDLLDVVAVHGFPLSQTCRYGFQKRVSQASAPRKCRNGVCGAPPSCSSVKRPAFTGIACMICRAPGPRPRATVKRKGRLIIVIFTWACCARTARPN